MSHEENTNQNYKELQLYTQKNGYNWKKRQLTSVGKDVKPTENFTSADKKVKRCSHFGLAIPDPAIPRLSVCPREMKTYIPTKKLYTNVHSSTIYNLPKVETTQIAINWWMDKQNMIYPHNGLSFGSKKEWSIEDICYNKDKTWIFMLRERNQSQKTTNYITPFIWNFQNRQIYGNKETG